MLNRDFSRRLNVDIYNYFDMFVLDEVDLENHSVSQVVWLGFGVLVVKQELEHLMGLEVLHLFDLEYYAMRFVICFC